MGIITNEEKKLIYQYIENGYESTNIDYKQQNYKLEISECLNKITSTNDFYAKIDSDQKNVSPKAHFDIIKDTLSFLNVPSFNDKYILMGVKDSGEIIGLEKRTDERYSSDIRQLLNEYIEPTPKIEFFDLKLDSGKIVGVLKIDKINTDFPYLLKKDITYIKKDKLYTVSQGSSFIREGSTNRNINIEDWRRYLKIREESLINILYLNQDFNDKPQLRYLINTMDKFINKSVFETFVKKEKMFLEKFMFILTSIQEVKNNEYIFTTNNNVKYKYLIEHINKGLLNFKELKDMIDNGINSLLIKIFIFAHKIHQIFSNEFCTIDFESNTLTFKIAKDLKDIKTYNKIIEDKNELELVFYNLRNVTEENTYFSIIKLVGINFFDIEDEDKKFLSFESKFQVSNKIIPLLIGPLYGEDSLYIGARELLQNAIDACKEKRKKEEEDCANNNVNCEYEPKINVTIKMKDKENDNNNSVLLSIEDNGIGMTKEVLQNSYFNIGTSSKGASKIGLVGKFGIGVLSGFLMGDNIKVSTKSDEDQFEYNFVLDKPTADNIDDSNFEYNNIINRTKTDMSSGTKIELLLEQDIQTIEKAFEVLKMKDWCVCDNIEIKLNIDTNKDNFIPKLVDDTIKWSQIDLNNSDLNSIYNTEISILIDSGFRRGDDNKNKFKDKDEEEKYIAIRNNYQYLNGNRGKIIYNGILINSKYERNVIKKLYNVPLIRIEDKSNRNYNKDSAFFIPLDREYIKINNYIWELIENWLWKKQFKTLRDLKLTMFEEQIFSSQYFDNTEFIYTKNGFGLNYPQFKKYLGTQGYQDIVTIYTNNFSNLRHKLIMVENRAYIIKKLDDHKSKIADVIENYDVKAISVGLIEKYFLNEYNRMRRMANKKVIDLFITADILPYGAMCTSTTLKEEIDQKINQNMTKIREHLGSNPFKIFKFNKDLNLNEFAMTCDCIVLQESLGSSASYYSSNHLDSYEELKMIHAYYVQENSYLEEENIV